jgi:hypothetical protein
MIDPAVRDEPRAVRRSSKRRRRFRQARSAVVAGLLAFAVLQVALAIAGESLLPELRDPPFATKLRHLQQRTT